MSKPISIVALVSGSGTTVQNLQQQIIDGKLNARIDLVIGSKPGLVGIERATQAGLKSAVVDRKQHHSVASFSAEVFKHCDRIGPDLLCLAGWLCLLELPKQWEGRAINIHPALLPAFGGKGMYGKHVHEAVLAHGCKVSGCTVHFVDTTYDTGPIILQRTCPVLEGDTPESLAHRVFEEEKIAYPEVIRLFADGRLRIEGRTVRVLESNGKLGDGKEERYGQRS